MNRLLNDELIHEMHCGENLAYVLKRDDLFFPTEYKVLQNQLAGSFVKCVKMRYNGHIQLYYMINTLKPLPNVLPSIDADSFVNIVANLFASIIAIRSNGFLSCQNVELSFDKIYVNPNTLKVSLIYLPTYQHLIDDSIGYESQLRANLAKLINGTSSISTAKTMNLAADLCNGMLTLDDIYSRLRDVNPIPEPAAEQLRIVSISAPVQVVLDVDKDSFVIGRKASEVDGVVSFSKMIGRVHCRVDRAGTLYTITDLQSSNGTFVNGERLLANRPYPLKDGDIIRLANSDFRVMVVQGREI